MNATIGRAVNLVMMNVFRSVPGVCDLDCIASQAEFTYCFAEEPRIKEHFTELGITNFVEYTETVRGKDAKKLYEYASVLAKEKPTAAIVAFGDMGTSSSTTVVTIALEKLGIPTVYMTAPPGTAITEGVGVYRAGHLCLCSVDIYQASTVEEVAAQVDLKWEYIISSLTSNGDQLEKLAHIDFKMDKVAPAENGLLPLELDADEERSHEPADFRPHPATPSASCTPV